MTPMTENAYTVLAFDTSTSGCSVALLVGGLLAGEDMRSGPGNHSARLLQLVDRLLQDAQIAVAELDLLAVSQGPGSFTGLRVGISTAQGLGFALGKPVVGISSLEIVALQNMPFRGMLCPMLDARKAQVYTCLFEQTGADMLTPVRDEVVIAPEAWVRDLQGPVLFCGSGAEAYRDLISRCGAEHYFAPAVNGYPRAATLARAAARRYAAAGGMAPETVLPRYVRRPDAERKAAPGVR